MGKATLNSVFLFYLEQEEYCCVRQVSELIKWIIGSYIPQKYCYLYPKHDSKLEKKRIYKFFKSILKILMSPRIPEIASPLVLFSTINGHIYIDKQVFIS